MENKRNDFKREIKGLKSQLRFDRDANQNSD